LVLLVLTMLCGAGFLVSHGFEYLHEAREGLLPGKYYSFPELTLPGANLFFACYFLMTGLHSLHVIAGICVLGWMVVKILFGQLTPVYDTPLENATLYWHLVDLIWIFLFPLLYLI
jgi:cytochrome c oxidase subunit 3